MMIAKCVKRYLVGIMSVVLLAMMFANIPAISANAMDGDTLTLYKTVFDANYYYSAYPEIAAVYGPNYMALLGHFISTGAREGRSASAVFNPIYYKQTYPDLAAAFGDNIDAYVRHYITSGIREGRRGNSEEAKAVKILPVSINSVNPEMIGEYTTKYDAKIKRATNVSLASASINGTIVMPNEIFSYTKTVGPRTTARGYVEAPIYTNGQVGKGIGGGICQVSSTLYACMKKIGLPATERHAHSLPVHYVPSGWDATISGTTLDLKFKNIYQYPLYIEATANAGILTVRLYLLK